MAKKQTFGDKTSKKSQEKGAFIKLVRSIKTRKGAVSFKKEILEIPLGKNPESYIKEKYPNK